MNKADGVSDRCYIENVYALASYVMKYFYDSSTRRPTPNIYYAYGWGAHLGKTPRGIARTRLPRYSVRLSTNYIFLAFY